ncbi:Coiled-coil domain-containing protein 146 [Caenorhabditis elegans]|uniref:Coiled-coil domain-containing protein 146 n=1 Tax=Caenorhabditis elegans TaxID=6239 RepID=Q69Z10_CAEEL|nr:Coiled-coil domain-containing protein 146 [Caenorhabditis elegans]CAH10780.1 Coiled-coil domain-containing protein 146 [Caenorhabditis elegans]|eukprot:NP_001021615.1 Uncharacterized protein CELE_T06G6.3 [Caenorhabditis elegans]
MTESWSQVFNNPISAADYFFAESLKLQQRNNLLEMEVVEEKAANTMLRNDLKNCKGMLKEQEELLAAEKRKSPVPGDQESEDTTVYLSRGICMMHREWMLERKEQQDKLLLLSGSLEMERQQTAETCEIITMLEAELEQEQADAKKKQKSLNREIEKLKERIEKMAAEEPEQEAKKDVCKRNVNHFKLDETCPIQIIKSERIKVAQNEIRELNKQLDAEQDPLKKLEYMDSIREKASLIAQEAMDHAELLNSVLDYERDAHTEIRHRQLRKQKKEIEKLIGEWKVKEKEHQNDMCKLAQQILDQALEFKASNKARAKEHPASSKSEEQSSNKEILSSLEAKLKKEQDDHLVTTNQLNYQSAILNEAQSEIKKLEQLILKNSEELESLQTWKSDSTIREQNLMDENCKQYVDICDLQNTIRGLRFADTRWMEEHLKLNEQVDSMKQGFELVDTGYGPTQGTFGVVEKKKAEEEVTVEEEDYEEW